MKAGLQTVGSEAFSLVRGLPAEDVFWGIERHMLRP